MRLKRPRPASIWIGFLATMMVINLFLLRPSALGEQFTVVGVGAAVAFLLIFQIGRPANLRVRVVPQHVIWTFGLLVTYWLYESLLVIFGAAGATDSFLKETATVAVVVACYAWPLSNPEFNRVFFRRFSAMIGFLGLSAGITAVLALSGGLERLFLTSVEIKGYSTAVDAETGLSTGAIYFPLSMAYNRFTTDDVELFRFCGFFREAGIFQAFCCFAFAYEAFTGARRWVMLGAIAGVAAALSTIGTGLMVMQFGMVYALRRPGRLSRRVFGVGLLFGLAALAVLFTPHIGLLDKSVTHYTTVTDREAAMDRSLTLLLSNPIGTGPYTWYGQNAGINLIAQAGYIGALGFVLQVILMSGWRMRIDRENMRRIACCAPLMLTAVASQPLNGAPMVYIMALAIIPLQGAHPLWWRVRVRVGAPRVRSEQQQIAANY